MKDILEQIQELKRQRNAIILAHNYQRQEIQDIADFIGDSLELSRTASSINCDVIVFCGVHFMAESASILSPSKIVLLPELGAGCPMADMIEVDSIRMVWKQFPGYKEQPKFIFPDEFTLKDMKNKYPDADIVAYINTTAEIKAYSDICCTSANIIKVIESLPNEEIICVPDRNLSKWAEKNSNKKIISWDGFCHVHDRILKEDVIAVKEQHQKALFVAHPECRIEVLEMADCVTSTTGMLRFASSNAEKEFIIGTETGLIYRLKKENPNKIFHPLRQDMLCPNMKKTTLNSVLNALKEMKNIIKVQEDIRIPAKRALDRMLEIK